MSNPTRAAQRLLARIRTAATEKIPAGFKTKEQWGEEWHTSKSKTGDLLRTATESKPPIMKMLRLRALDTTGRTNSICVYGEVKAKE